MSLGSQFQESLREFHNALPDESDFKAIVQKDMTQLRRNGVDGVGVLDDTAFEILSRLYYAQLQDKPKAADSVAKAKASKELPG